MKPTVPLLAILLSASMAFADYRDAIGHTALAQELGNSLPTGSGISVSQIEAPDALSNHLPDTADAEFAGKTFVTKSAASGVSGHATTVAKYFYGVLTSMGTGIGLATNSQQIDNYEAGDWTSTGFLNNGTPSAPKVESRDIENHSWVGSSTSTSVTRRFDFAVNRDDFVAVIGINQVETGTSLNELMASAYHGITVGRTDGNHISGKTTLDGADRIKPDIVAPSYRTSYATPMVGAAAALLLEKARGSSLFSAQDKEAPLIKAMLMAGATKDEFPGWARSATQPLDLHYGAGELNIQNSYHILVAGRQAASSSATRSFTGWDYGATASGAGRFYFFEIGAGQKAATFSALLTWHRVIADTIAGPSWGNLSSSLANLTLRLYSASGFVVGAQIDASTSAVDNVEHVFQRDLPAGRYALEVTGDSGGVPYALAWEAQTIPLPVVSVSAPDDIAAEFGGDTARFEFARTSTVELGKPLTVQFTVTGNATNGADYTTVPGSIAIPAGSLTAPVDINPILDTEIEGPETVTVTISTNAAYVVGASSSAAATIKDRPIDQWKFEKFTPAQRADPQISGDLADPESDGIANIFEYGLALAPLAPDATGLPQVNVVNEKLRLTYTQVKSATDILYRPVVSEDLATWEGGSEFVLEIDREDGGATDLVTVEAAAPSGARQFIRLQITRK